MGNDLLFEENIAKDNIKIAIFASGIVSVLFIFLFLLMGIILNNVPIAIVGGGFTIISTAITHVVFGFESKSKDEPEHIIRIDNNAEMETVSQKYHILQNMGHGLYRVSRRKDCDEEE